MSFTEFTQKAAAFIMSIVLLLSTSLFGKVYPPEDAEDNTCFTPEGQTMTLIDDNASEYKIIYGSEACPCQRQTPPVFWRDTFIR
jgi:hypothetical protein